LLTLAAQLEIPEMITVPVSALEGDNVVHRSQRMTWYDGPSLMELLETVPLAIERSHAGLRFPVQRVLRPHQDFRGFAGQIAAGTVHPGDEVVALPSGIRTRVRSIVTWEGDLEEAHAPQSVVLTLEDETDLSRGDMIATVAAPPQKTKRFVATVVWMHSTPLRPGASYLLKHTSQTVPARVVAIRSRIDVEHLEQHGADQLSLNDIGEVVIETNRPLLADLYRENRTVGSLILIDPADNATAGAGMVRSFEDQDESAPELIHATGALLILGDRQELAAELEKVLLKAGALTLRTRTRAYAALLAVARTGAVILMEGDERGPVKLTTVGAHATDSRELAFDDTDAILNELQRLGALPAGDSENDAIAQ
jgi:sulfate adenylyltransferase subunit 1 (EFTu-like GTPase family)